jgi:hypothetical protein
MKDKPSVIKLDFLLDKISKYGIRSLTEREYLFLRSFSNHSEDEYIVKYDKMEAEEVFEDFDGLFIFEYIDISNTPYSKIIHGRLYVPDLKLKSDTIPGVLEGCIISSNDGKIVLNFKNGEWDVWDFCNGLECELDIFIDGVVREIEEKRGFKI